MPYDRTALHVAAHAKGDHTPTDVGRRLALTGATAWRLYHGYTAPSARVAAAVETHYGIPARQLLIATREAS